jgi:NAD(P)-dependent dehydrogenase (short-subunit alcohol dehydrogenase family)
MAEFAGKVIIVTGASEGIGRALCIALAPQKPRLVLAARNAERLEELEKEVEALGAEAIVVPTDVTDQEACKALIDRTLAAYGAIDVLVNNAGGTMWTKLEDITDLSIFERLMRLNYLGSVFPTYYALPYLKQSKGRIVGLSSVAGITGVPTRTAYAASKHAMFGFFDSLRIEVAEYGVSVTMVAPDYVVSEIHRRALGSDGQPLGKSPLQESKVMTADTCAQLIVGAMERRERLLLTSSRGKLGRWLKLLAPQLMDNIAAKAIREKK